MTRLLVSVRSVEEAVAALAGGADVVDVKEPSRGSLGAADQSVRHAIARAVHPRPISFAFGELADWKDGGVDAPAGSFAKIGPAGLDYTEWYDRWHKWRRALPAKVTPVAVAYADYHAAESPDPRLIADFAAGKCRWLLIDTWNKAGGGLFDVAAPDQLHTWIATARDFNLQVALAGSLRFAHLELIRELAPDIVAVRGAVCRGGRAGQLDAALVREWTTAVQAFPPAVVNHSRGKKSFAAKLSSEIA